MNLYGYIWMPTSKIGISIEIKKLCFCVCVREDIFIIYIYIYIYILYYILYILYNIIYIIYILYKYYIIYILYYIYIYILYYIYIYIIYIYIIRIYIYKHTSTGTFTSRVGHQQKRGFDQETWVLQLSGMKQVQSTGNLDHGSIEEWAFWSSGHEWKVRFRDPWISKKSLHPTIHIWNNSGILNSWLSDPTHPSSIVQRSHKFQKEPVLFERLLNTWRFESFTNTGGGLYHEAGTIAA